MLRAILLSLGIFLGSAAAWATSPTAGPLATTRDIRNLHPRPSGEWRLTYKDEGGQKEQAQLVLTLAPDYVSRQDGKNTQIFDFSQARIYTLTAGNTSFDNDSLHANVLFRVQELQNRNVLSGALAAAKIDKPPPQLDPFWAECELSMQLPNHVSEIIRRDDGGTLALWHGETLAVRATLGPVAPEAVRARLGRLWRHALPIYPQMARELAASGRAPRTLELATINGDKVVPRTLTLGKAEWVEHVEFPLPATAERAPDRGTPTTIAMLETAQEAVRKGAHAPTLDTYFARMKDSLARGAALEAALWGTEALLSGRADLLSICPSRDYRGEPCDTFMQALFSRGNDARARTMFGKGGVPKDTPVPDLSDLSSAHVGRLLIATRKVMAGAGGKEIEEAYRSALTEAPGVVGYYKDIGDYYVRAYDHPTAWKFYDLARMLPDHNTMSLLVEITETEAKLRKDFPELY